MRFLRRRASYSWEFSSDYELRRRPLKTVLANERGELEQLASDVAAHLNYLPGIGLRGSF